MVSLVINTKKTIKAGDKLYAPGIVAIALKASQDNDCIIFVDDPNFTMDGYIIIGEELIELKDGECLRHVELNIDSLKLKNGGNLDS